MTNTGPWKQRANQESKLSKKNLLRLEVGRLKQKNMLRKKKEQERKRQNKMRGKALAAHKANIGAVWMSLK